MEESITVPLPNGGEMILDKVDFERLKQEGWSYGRWTPRGVPYVHIQKRNPTSGKFHGTRLHRFVTNAGKGQVVCHLNGNGLDNRRQNLHVGTHADNAKSFRVKRRHCSSKYRGVHSNKPGRKNPWVAAIKINSRTTHLGVFKTELDAAKAYDAAAVKHYGSLAAPNFPQTTIQTTTT